ncbi:alpha/beta fold hydrolase [Lapillicoccus sp.]|uniref:PHA/PHB synthase family protein n=1 Tax=Lapillicoccus sp. TaxID=1909287 RepID=UPI0025EFFC6C|nr:alpha/beta fold hydrolase [Lapillicoccus sp.]
MAVDVSTRPEAGTAGSPQGSGDGDENDVAAPLDSLLAEAVFNPLRRFNPGLPGLRMGAQLAARPMLLGRAATSTAAELARVVLGTSTAASAPKDRRFTDPAWSDNPVLHRVLQAYLVAGRAATELVSDADLDWEDHERLAFVAQNIVEALSPSNNPVLNPAALKAGLDSGGASYLRGVRNFARDMAVKPRVPSMVDTTAFAVGDNLAVTPGSVVLRTEVFELIQYTPQTARVRTTPLLMVPPTINKYYVADLAPGRSMVEHFVASGQQVFMVSWRNPDRPQADWGLDAYVAAVIEALGAVEDICRTTKTVLFSLCAGGIISSLALAHLVATGQEHRLAGFALGVTLLDQSRAGLMSSLTSRQVATVAAAKSRADGYLDGRSLAEVFAWLRPGDLVWNYWVNNYLLGKQPPAFDVLYWNADTTRMAAKLHADFLDLAVTNALTRPGETSVLGTPVDLSAVTVDSYVIAGVADHICPWTSCYRSVRMLGGHSRFVLSTSGHIAALVNPPGNPKASYRASDDTPDDPQEFLGAVEPTPGTWWTDFVVWLTARSGRQKAAPKTLGSARHPVVVAAPGTYVYAT